MVTTRLLTAQDLWKLGDSAETYEIIDGEFAPMVPPSGEHGAIQATLISSLRHVVMHANLGRVYGESGYVLQHNPDVVLAPDISFIAGVRVPADQTGYLDLAPDLAIEIVSPSKSPGEIEQRLAIYLRTGVRSIWIVYPRDRQVVVHAPGNAPSFFKATDELTGGEVVPGLSFPVSELFE
ncbi:Uma2 family endonuclease [soil metagenome]